MSEKLNIYEKIQKVSLAVMNIEKDIQVGKGNYGYKAVSDQSVVLAVKNAEKDLKLVSIPIKTTILNQSEIKTAESDGREKIQYSIWVELTTKIVDLEDINSFIEVTSIGHGLDSGDKSSGKAMTYARKYALLNAYKIATGEDPDYDASKTTHAPSIDEKKIAVINYYKQDSGLESSLVAHFGLHKIEDMSKEQVEMTYNNLVKNGKL